MMAQRVYKICKVSSEIRMRRNYPFVKTIVMNTSRKRSDFVTGTRHSVLGTLHIARLRVGHRKSRHSGEAINHSKRSRSQKHTITSMCRNTSFSFSNDTTQERHRKRDPHYSDYSDQCKSGSSFNQEEPTGPLSPTNPQPTASRWSDHLS